MSAISASSRSPVSRLADSSLLSALTVLGGSVWRFGSADPSAEVPQGWWRAVLRFLPLFVTQLTWLAGLDAQLDMLASG
jgi:hypothetical protein